ncbi:hypothetical protein [Pseudorhodobacter ferrugineus]|uniref:hypothetical protein n=1 Tax=Pseudorhodobacter ferrugineus TaxID=77008 RepID=UPI0003B34502|nr:hypothetical protein [Pseudorhodobacter ferrugineus]
MFRYRLFASFIIIVLTASPSLATQQENCIADVLAKGGSYRSLSEFEAAKLLDISKNPATFAGLLKNVAKNAVVLDDNGNIAHFVRFRRDEVFFTALYICLNLDGP